MLRKPAIEHPVELRFCARLYQTQGGWRITIVIENQHHEDTANEHLLVTEGHCQNRKINSKLAVQFQGMKEEVTL